MQRFSLVGPPGAGKTTLASALAGALDLHHVELDRHYHLPGWTPCDRKVFRATVQGQLSAHPRWIVDGNYNSSVQDIVWARAEAVVWLDLPRRVVLPALLSRTLRRGLRGEELWNGNRERPWQILDPRPEENIVLWCLTRYAEYRARYLAAMTDPAWSHLRFFRLRSRAEVAAFVEQLTG
jgi:adenylate kinase family enzyme